MSDRFFRIYKKFYIDEVKTHLMTYGALSGTCANCKKMDLKIDTPQCPECNTEFKYVAFQNIREHMPKMLKISRGRPQIIFVDYDDFKRIEGEEKAKGIRMIDKERLITITTKLLQINSANPPGNEVAVADYVARDLKAIGLDIKIYSFAKNRPNVVATLKGTWPRAKAAREALLITPHYDTVPFGEGWKFDPLGATIHSGRIYGRGASDDKGNCAVGMEALHSLVEDGVRLQRDIVFAATADEETGSKLGVIPLLKKGILRPKAALITDSEEFDAIIAQKGLFHCRVQIFGKKAHGAYNWLGVNAIEIAARVINRLKKHQFKYKKHPLLVPPTKNIGTIRGGDKVNMVADFCEFALDIRFMPGMKAEGVLREVKSIVAKETKNFKVIIDDAQKPYGIDPQHPFVKTYVDTCRKMGFKANLKGSQGATVITFFQDYGIPAFSTGWGSHGVIHANDEYAEIKTLHNGAKVLEAFIKEYDAR